MKPPTVKIKNMPSRFKHQVPKYKVTRSDDCINCGTCAKTCPYGVHERAEGYNRVKPPIDYKCIGFECQSKDFCCITKCPRKALSLSLNPMYETLGDYRWTPDMITGTWIMAETGYPPQRTDLEYNVGNSGGGFDKLRFKFPKNPPRVDKSKISTEIPLNRRNDGRANIVISTPVYGGGMSFGSVSLPTMVSKARNATAWNTFTCTGEGGYPDILQPYDGHVITQVATGLFGVREETIQRVNIVEFKYAQGAKPGLGGHLLGEKVTESVAKMREAVKGSSLFLLSLSTQSILSKTTKNILTGLKRLIRKPWFPSRFQRRMMLIWSRLDRTTQAHISSILMEVMAALVPPRILPRKILPCLSNMLSPRYITS